MSSRFQFFIEGINLELGTWNTLPVHHLEQALLHHQVEG